MDWERPVGFKKKKFEMEELPGGLLFYRLPAGRSFGPISFDMFELRSGSSTNLLIFIIFVDIS